MNDYLLRVTAADGYVRGFFATTRDTVNHAFAIHGTAPVVTAALGRLLTAAAIFGAMHANPDDITTLVVKGDGPVGGLVVTTDSASHVKGYAYETDLPTVLKPDGKLDVGAAVGAGTLAVVKDIGMKEPYHGQISLVSGEIAEDVAAYFAQSEQTPSAVALGVLVDTDYTVKQAGGFVIQLMPGCPGSVAEKLEANVAALPRITSLLDQGKTPEDILELTLGCFGFSVNDAVPVSYACNCTRERVEKALISLGRQELESILEEDGKATLHCHFCNKDYHFSQSDLLRVLQGKH